MTFDEIMESIIVLAENDQSIDDTAMTVWIQQGINRINQALHTRIPTTVVGNEEPKFDSTYHESLVLFGVMKYRESDSSYNDAMYFMDKFDTMVNLMKRDMAIPPSIMADFNTQQITVEDALVYDYQLTIPSGSYYDTVKVYVNDVEVKHTVDQFNQLLRINPITTLVSGDQITVRFENNSDLNEPPYQWWSF